MKVYARHNLVHDDRPVEERALLLEGCWPRGDSTLRQSLDEVIDGRHAWIDDEASRLADRLAQADRSGAFAEDASGRAGPPTSCPGPAYLNELKLRYYFVKLLRAVAFFEENQTDRGPIELMVAADRDEDYVELLTSLARAHHRSLSVVWRTAAPRAPISAPRNAWWRQAAAAVSARTNPRWQPAGAPRVVLCGNRRLLNGVCGELVRRGASVAWLYDRFAVQTWLRWRAWGVGQLVCSTRADRQSPAGTKIDHPQVALSSRGIDLGPAIARWLVAMEDGHGEHHARLWLNIDRHFARVRPTLLVIDEDATPMARAAVAAARRYEVPSVVIQHGVPRVKFGFAPLAADYLFVWGDASRRQFLRWGVPLERIRVTGWPVGGLDRTSNIERPTSNVERWEPSSRWQAFGRRLRPLEILLFATTPPRDDRPDSVAFHLTDRTHRQMLRSAFAAVAGIPGARLTIKLHPRCRDESVFREVAAEFAQLRCRIIRRGSIRQLAGRAACVFSCISGAGVEASHLGAKVIDLIPAGSVDLMPASQWGTLGTARTDAELAPLLRMALDRSVPRDVAVRDVVPNSPRSRGETTPDNRRVFAALGQEAAGRVVEELFQIQSFAANAARGKAA